MTGVVVVDDVATAPMSATKVCPEDIKITDNAIIPLKERVVDEFFDPIKKILKLFRSKK